MKLSSKAYHYFPNIQQTRRSFCWMHFFYARSVVSPVATHTKVGIKFWILAPSPIDPGKSVICLFNLEADEIIQVVSYYRR